MIMYRAKRTRCNISLHTYFSYICALQEAEDVCIPTCFPNLVDVTIHDCTGRLHIAALSTFTGLCSLDLKGCSDVDISVLASCTNLRRLNLSRSGVQDLSPLSMCASLRKLDISGNAELGLQIQFLAPCTNLNELVVVGCKILDTIDPFVHVPNKGRLTLAHKSTYIGPP